MIKPTLYQDNDVEKPLPPYVAMIIATGRELGKWINTFLFNTVPRKFSRNIYSSTRHMAWECTGPCCHWRIDLRRKKGKGWEVSSYNAEHVNCVSIGVPKSTHIAHVGKLLSSCGRLQCLYDCHIIVWHSLGTSDGENRDVLVAFAVVPAESAADYIWFIKNMKHSAQLNTWLNENCMRLCL